MHKDKRLSRKEREHLARRSDILDAALRLFVRKGYHSVSMREIAAEAEFATGTLYSFFDSKEELHAELVKTFAHRVLNAVVPSLHGVGDEREKLSRFIHSLMRVLSENADAVQLYFRQSQGFVTAPSDSEEEVRKVREAIHSELTQVLAAGVRKGIFRGVHPQASAAALSGLLESLIFHNVKAAPGPAPVQIAAIAEDLLFHGILNGETRT